MKADALRELTARHLPAGKHADGHGLWLVKRDREHGKWVLRLIADKQRREMGLGPWPDVSISEARQRAADARKLWRTQNDPIEARRRAKVARKPLTVKEAIEGCFEARKAELKDDGVAGRWMSPMTVHVIPNIGKTPIEELDQHVIKNLLAPLWHTKTEAAAKALNRLNLTLRHAAALGLEVDLQATMKARALLGKQRHTTEHIPSLPYDDASDFYAWLCTEDGISALALRFLILTMGRTTEVRLATTIEVSGGTWTLPPERTKTGLGRRIPLTTEAQSILAIAKGRSPNGYYFASYRGKPMSDMAMSTFMGDHGYIARPHGFRSTFRTWAEECTDVTFEVKEAALGHSVDTGVVGAYQRSDRFEKVANLLEAWRLFLTERTSNP